MSQPLPWLATVKDRQYRTRRVRLCFWMLYHGVHVFIDAQSKETQDRALDEMIRAHRDLQAMGVSLNDVGVEEVPG